MKWIIEIPHGWTPQNCDLCGTSSPQDVCCCDCPVALATPYEEKPAPPPRARARRE